MSEQEVRLLIKKNHLTWDEFCEFMKGQTVGMNEDGSTNFYDCDVKKFIEKRGKINVFEWD